MRFTSTLLRLLLASTGLFALSSAAPVHDIKSAEWRAPEPVPAPFLSKLKPIVHSINPKRTWKSALATDQRRAPTPKPPAIGAGVDKSDINPTAELKQEGEFARVMPELPPADILARKSASENLDARVENPGQTPR
ncbi:hypothetical protein MKEN_01163100 [Mycena kentingensis (nom. inval.)]|nr:hypothetical protein MKEN_01163100 [Mycena kentingensis (nom. inval.)]